MDALIAALMDTGQPQSTTVEHDYTTPGILLVDKITVIGVNYFENLKAKGGWMQSKQTVKLQIFTKADERFTPHHSLAEMTCIAQLHGVDFVSNYVGEYRREYEGSRSVPTEAQVDWYARFANETLAKHPGALIGQLYETPGTTYHWGSVVRLRPAGEAGIMKLDLFLDGERFATIPLDQPNEDKNPKTASIKFRGRYDPKNLWKARTKPKRKP